MKTLIDQPKEKRMVIKKLVLASAILLGLAACSHSGGGNGSAVTASDNKQQLQLKEQLRHTESEKNEALQKIAKLTQQKAELERRLQGSLSETEKNTLQSKLQQLEQEKSQLNEQLNNKTQLWAVIEQKAQQIAEDSGGGKGIDNVPWYDLSKLNKGLNQFPFITITNDGDNIVFGERYIYQQPHSTILSRNVEGVSVEETLFPKGSFRIDRIEGEITQTIPSQGTATYMGKGFNGDKLGDFTYQVDFDQRIGSGYLRNLEQVGNIELKQGNITQSGIQSPALTQDGVTGQYQLQFYGPNADEIAGEVYMHKQWDNMLKTNGNTAKKYADTERGTVFGLAAEKQ